MIVSSSNPNNNGYQPEKNTSTSSSSSSLSSAVSKPLPGPVSLSRQGSAKIRPGNTSFLNSVQPPPKTESSRQKTEDSKKLQEMFDKYSKQSSKLDRMTISYNKLKKQHKQHDNVLARERAQYEEEIQGLRRQLRVEKSLRRNMEEQQRTLSSSSSSSSSSSLSSTNSSNLSSSTSSSSSVSRPPLVATASRTLSSTAITKRQPRRAVALYTDFDCVFHSTPTSHPESPKRVMVLWERLYNAFDERLDWNTNSPRVAINMLMNVHSPTYISRFLNACKYLPNNNVPKNFMLCCQGASGSHKSKSSKHMDKEKSGKFNTNKSNDSNTTGSTSNSPIPINPNDHDTFFSSNAGGGSVSAGLKAPGSVVAAVDAVLSGVR